MSLHRLFTETNKSLIIAPAGYGKTHFIVECLRHTTGHQLILTHTNAGVAAIKDKLRKQNVAATCSVETITGFAQKYVFAFIGKAKFSDPDEDDYFPTIVQHATKLFRAKSVRMVLSATYEGVFVDEYQDCTKLQHALIVELAGCIPLRILGDPLQGIFDFNDELVDFEMDMSDFVKIGALETPHRWRLSNQGLGADLIHVRKLIEERRVVNFTELSNINYYTVEESDLFVRDSVYNRVMWETIGVTDSLLIIHPVSENKNARINMVKKFSNTFCLVESSDAKDFYLFARKVDACDEQNGYDVIREIAETVFNKTGVDQWLGDKRPKIKKRADDRRVIAPLTEIVQSLRSQYSLDLMSKALHLVKKLPGIKCHRSELLNDICNAISKAIINGETVLEAMKTVRDKKRHIGRKIDGRCIGTTLLTKGLEFDTVIILDAHKFSCAKNFYVAATRASRKLIIFSEKSEVVFS